jgi:hypothetical protein
MPAAVNFAVTAQSTCMLIRSAFTISILLLVAVAPRSSASAMPIAAAYGTWMGTLYNNPTMIYIAPGVLQVEASINPFQSAVQDFHFIANYSLAPLDASLLLTRIDTALGSRFLQVRFAVAGAPPSLYMAFGATTPSTAIQPLSAQISTNELMSTPTFLYFKGSKNQEYGADARRDPQIQQLCTHTVAQGESVASVAAKYGQQWQDLFALNAFLTDPQQSIVGRSLAIGRAYRVAPGETLWSIASMFGTSWLRLVDSNPRLASCKEQAALAFPVCRIQVGDILCVVPFLRNAICIAPNPARQFRVSPLP